MERKTINDEERDKNYREKREWSMDERKKGGESVKAHHPFTSHTNCHDRLQKALLYFVIAVSLSILLLVTLPLHVTIRVCGHNHTVS